MSLTTTTFLKGDRYAKRISDWLRKQDRWSDICNRTGTVMRDPQATDAQKAAASAEYEAGWKRVPGKNSKYPIYDAGYRLQKLTGCEPWAIHDRAGLAKVVQDWREFKRAAS